MRPPVITVSLVHIQGPLKGKIQELSQETIRIGRHPSNDVRFPADLTIVSRYHAEIIREGNRFRLRDKSANGTFVNGKKVVDAFLKDGDVIEFSDGGPKASFLTQMREDEADEGSLSADESTFSEDVSRVQAPPERIRREPGRPPFPGISEEPSPRPPTGPPLREPVYAAPREPDREIPIQTVTAPLVIQYGPTVRSYKQLPVVMGRHPKCDFVLNEPSILDQHVQVFYSQNRYWVKDLTGQRLVRINEQPLASATALVINDTFALTPQGPAFRFVGEGRLAEYIPTEEPGEQPASDRPASSPTGPGAPLPDKSKYGILSKVKKKLF